MHNFDPKLTVDYLSQSPLDDLELASQLIFRNKKLLKDYPSLEESLRLLDSVISREMD